MEPSSLCCKRTPPVQAPAAGTQTAADGTAAHMLPEGKTHRTDMLPIGDVPAKNSKGRLRGLCDGGIRRKNYASMPFTARDRRDRRREAFFQ